MVDFINSLSFIKKIFICLGGAQLAGASGGFARRGFSLSRAWALGWASAGLAASEVSSCGAWTW